MKQQKQSGFAHLMIIVIVLALAVVCLLGFVFWQNFIQPKTTSVNTDNTETTSSVATSEKESSDNMFTIDTVSFRTPKNWTKHSEWAADSTSNSLGGISFIPGERIPFPLDIQPFTVSIVIYSNIKSLAPQDWLTNDAGNPNIGGLGLMMDGDVQSFAKINGYDAYYRRIAHSSNYKEVHYVISSKGKLVYVYARPYEEGNDLTRFEPVVKNLASSVSIK